MNKKLLIFTGVGDNENHFLSWAENTNIYFDRAINYYGNDVERLKFLRSKNTEYFFNNQGMIWENFYKNYLKFNSYQYYLIVDSDLDLNVYDIEKTLRYVIKNNIHGSTWSRTEDSYGYFTPLFLSRKIQNDVYYSNWIEMCFMFLSNELTNKTVDKWGELDLSWSTGIDFVVANTAAENNMLPFRIFNDYTFRNLHPHEKKNGREIDQITGSDTKQRLKEIFKKMETNNFFQIQPKDILVWQD